MTHWGALALVPAFGVDTFAVAVGLGTVGVAERWRPAIVVALFEGGMPLLGTLVGGWLGRLLAGYAVWGAAALLAALGLRQLTEGWRGLHRVDLCVAGQATTLLARRLAGWGLVVAGLSVSLDDLGAGLAAGAARLPMRVLAPALAVQAAIATYAGLNAGAALRRWAGRYGELVAGGALLVVALVVLCLAGR